MPFSRSLHSEARFPHLQKRWLEKVVSGVSLLFVCLCVYTQRQTLTSSLSAGLHAHRG